MLWAELYFNATQLINSLFLITTCIYGEFTTHGDLARLNLQCIPCAARKSCNFSLFLITLISWAVV